jgi:hypothetical protein
MLKKLLATVAFVCGLAAPAYADGRFLNAASYFLSGFDADNGVKYTVLKNGSEAAIGGDAGIMVFQDDHKPCTVHYMNFIVKKLEIAQGGPQVLTAMTVDFTKIPSPRDFGWAAGGWTVNLPANAITESNVKDAGNGDVSFIPSGKTYKTFYSGVFGNKSRRLNALDFIRANYCQGLPEVRGY